MRRLTVRGGLDVLESFLKRGNTLLEVLLFSPDNPLQLAVGAGGVVLSQLPLSLSHNRVLTVLAAEVDSSRLSSEAGSAVRDRSGNDGLGRSGLGDADIGADGSDRSDQVRRVGKSVVVPVRHCDAAGRKVRGRSSGLALRSLSEGLPSAQTVHSSSGTSPSTTRQPQQRPPSFR